MTATGDLSQHAIAGEVVTMPVRVRRAVQHTAMFSVAADAAQAMIDYSGLTVCRYRPRSAVVVLMLMHYIDSDLGRYHEYGTNVLVNPPGETLTGPRSLQSAGAFIHHLPVDQTFTLEAGRKIWGYPKILADFTIRDGQRQSGFDVSHDGKLIVGMEFRPGLPVPARFTSGVQTYRTYSHTDGVTRETSACQETHLLGPLSAVLRLVPKFFYPDLTGAHQLTGTQRNHGISDQLGGQTLGLQFLFDSSRAEFASASVDSRLQHPLLTDKPFGL